MSNSIQKWFKHFFAVVSSNLSQIFFYDIYNDPRATDKNTKPVDRLHVSVPNYSDSYFFKVTSQKLPGFLLVTQEG
jgi:hypothetical protein